jgi:hypothetical protein
MLKEMVAVVAIGMDAVVAEMVEVAAVVADQAAEVVPEAVADQVAEGVLVVEVVVPVEGTEKVVLVGVSAGDLKIRSFKWVEK